MQYLISLLVRVAEISSRISYTLISTSQSGLFLLARALTTRLHVALGLIAPGKSTH